MKNLARALVLVSLAACGGSNKNKPPDDGDVTTGAEPTQPPTPDAPAACATPTPGTNVTARQIGTVAGGAMLAVSPPGDPRLFVVDQSGVIRIFVNEQIQPGNFLDVSNTLVAGGEQGLLGLAFHPHYATNGIFFIDYTTNTADVVAKCSVSTADPNVANPTCTPVLSIPDPYSNHNAGMMEFGPDGLLYISTGDGGSGGDPGRRAQNKAELLGKMLRIDVDSQDPGKQYHVPTDNPFGTEVFMYGLRNPWRWSFDKMTGDLWIGDVGQGATEEVDVLKPSEQKGANLGWSAYEANTCCAMQADKCTQTGTQQACDPTGMTFPKLTHAASTGWHAVIGGEVYRGTCFPDIQGQYFYADNSRGHLLRAVMDASGNVTDSEVAGTFPSAPASIHADSRGELYLTTSSTPGKVFRLEVTP